ncbi:HK97 family phage prohead protease [Embleya scabrispora]|uniref:HK97 family phage prohead protease n=1 Tax=Embleya scabrispora TaxID=159449 RepID=UPI00137506DC|nr:HK97 family phage prohead protease [Embleya scabrispora]
MIEYRTVEVIESRIDDGEDGTFEGWGCRFGVVDSYGTTFHPKAFRKGGLKARDSFALLFMHDPYTPLGTFRAEERDDVGLWIGGRYDDTPDGATGRTRARSGSAAELSVGFVRTDLPPVDKLVEMSEEAYRDVMDNIRGARLVEVSQITARMASVPGSKLTTVRSALDDLYGADDTPDLLAVEAERARRTGAQVPSRRRELLAARARLTMAVPLG